VERPILNYTSSILVVTVSICFDILVFSRAPLFLVCIFVYPIIDLCVHFTKNKIGKWKGFLEVMLIELLIWINIMWYIFRMCWYILGVALNNLAFHNCSVSQTCMKCEVILWFLNASLFLCTHKYAHILMPFFARVNVMILSCIIKVWRDWRRLTISWHSAKPF